MPDTLLLDADDLSRTLDRLARQLLELWAPEERPQGDTVGLVGLQTRGVPLAHRLAGRLRRFEGLEVPVGALDATLYRDDTRRVLASLRPTHVPFDVEGRHLVLVDDVLYTGRSARAALDALTDLGRPASVRLAVLVDRGLRELPIRADLVGRVVPTRPGQRIRVRLAELDAEEGVWLTEVTKDERRGASEPFSRTLDF
ncbi:MAG TPA: bifunctional pyr operon transcriptional regulator/uracil phosphoribosyltransferase PyrR [Rhodothermales bacterium]|nr:bifunctional pyr operon transcriptional regulator/uracil phosphoribosyltransferase PyrR [Rhodothermales bacterium]